MKTSSPLSTRQSIDERLFLVVALGIAALTVLVYWPIGQFEFLNWDDLTYVQGNDYVKGGLTWAGIKWAFTSYYSGNWHPITWISHMLDCQIVGLRPGRQHLVNATIHILNSLLLFKILRSSTGFLWRSGLVAAIFALHPLHVESVAWISERKDVLSTFFGLLSIQSYLAFVTRSAPSGLLSSPPPQFRPGYHYALTLIFFALGLMSKPMLVTLPFVFLLLDNWPLDRCRFPGDLVNFKILSRLILEKAPFFALSAASCVVTFFAQSKGGAVSSLESISLNARLANAAVAFGAYVAKFFWPSHLSAIYPLTAHHAPSSVAGAALLLLIATIAVCVACRPYPYLFTGWFWFVGTLVPVIGIVQVGNQAYADRYMYIPSIGLSLAVVWLTADMVNRIAARTSLSTLKRPSNPANSAAAVIAAICVAGLAWRTAAQVPVWRDTETLFRDVLRSYPGNVQALYGLGIRLVEQGRLDEGKALLEEALRIQPAFPKALGALGNVFDDKGMPADAIRFYREALKFQPKEEGVLNNLAWLLASCPDPAFRDGAEAVRLASRACQITDYTKPIFVGTLAAAQAEAGDAQAAVATAERAANLAASLHLDETAKRNRELIELYRQGKAAHGGIPKAR